MKIPQNGSRHAGFDVQEPQFVMGMIYEAKTKELEYKQMIQIDKKIREEHKEYPCADYGQLW